MPWRKFCLECYQTSRRNLPNCLRYTYIISYECWYLNPSWRPAILEELTLAYPADAATHYHILSWMFIFQLFLSSVSPWLDAALRANVRNVNCKAFIHYLHPRNSSSSTWPIKPPAVIGCWKRSCTTISVLSSNGWRSEWRGSWTISGVSSTISFRYSFSF